MLIVSLIFTLVILVSFENLSSAFIASGSWVALSFMIFSGSAF